MSATWRSTTAVCMLTAQTAMGLMVARVTKDLKETVGHAVILMNAR